MKNLLYVVTSAQNMGDLALCQEWMTALGDVDYRHSFVVPAPLSPFTPSTCMTFQPQIPVGQTILKAAHDCRADAVILATNSFWSIPGQKGADWGHYPPELDRLTCPILSFDPLEVQVDSGAPKPLPFITFPPVPANVWALRYHSRTSQEAHARHFRMNPHTEPMTATRRARALAQWGGDPAKRTVFFPFSPNRYQTIRDRFPRYFAYLAAILKQLNPNRFQVLVTGPQPIPEFQDIALQTPLLAYADFIELVAAADLFLTDSLLSCMIYAVHAEVPTMLLANSRRSADLPQKHFMEGAFFPYRVFPYGFDKAGAILASRFEFRSCYHNSEILQPTRVIEDLHTLLTNENARGALIRRCRYWRKQRAHLPTPRQVLEDLLARA